MMKIFVVLLFYFNFLVISSSSSNIIHEDVSFRSNRVIQQLVPPRQEVSKVEEQDGGRTRTKTAPRTTTFSYRKEDGLSPYTRKESYSDAQPSGLGPLFVDHSRPSRDRRLFHSHSSHSHPSRHGLIRSRRRGFRIAVPNSFGQVDENGELSFSFLAYPPPGAPPPRLWSLTAGLKSRPVPDAAKQILHSNIGKDDFRSPDKVPIVITNFNLLYFLRLKLQNLYKYGFRNIHIIDNNSSYAPLLRFYFEGHINDHLLEQDHSFHMYRLSKNHGCYALWKVPWLIYALDIPGKRFVVTDPDVIFPATSQWLQVFNALLDHYPRILKAGPALRIDDLGERGLELVDTPRRLTRRKRSSCRRTRAKRKKWTMIKHAEETGGPRRGSRSSARGEGECRSLDEQGEFQFSSSSSCRPRPRGGDAHQQASLVKRKWDVAKESKRRDLLQLTLASQHNFWKNRVSTASLFGQLLNSSSMTSWTEPTIHWTDRVEEEWDSKMFYNDSSASSSTTPSSSSGEAASSSSTSSRARTSSRITPEKKASLLDEAKEWVSRESGPTPWESKFRSSFWKANVDYHDYVEHKDYHNARNSTSRPRLDEDLHEVFAARIDAAGSLFREVCFENNPVCVRGVKYGLRVARFGGIDYQARHLPWYIDWDREDETQMIVPPDYQVMLRDKISFKKGGGKYSDAYR
ncbi:unnamed protein product [Amoebophrya sp. A25]|nr:unnamed protein product [Amoebophrya sp. A25]|eukprot:GSA25T00007404001.1